MVSALGPRHGCHGPSVQLRRMQSVFPNATAYLKNHVFMIVVQGFANAYNMDLEALMKCCVGELIPDGRVIPFCAYNTVGYREQVRQGRIDGQIK